ncbi:hypothetical protein ACFO5R_17435 [Halosolutus amylolyticus]|uniref:Flagellin n=1 Tax=Halosolutus amylolyticus TaxID=2932267 RepID=A0ABD5PTG7_9EURY|nr:hypothetical protein [Halosolutus amylolyticus]
MNAPGTPIGRTDSKRERGVTEVIAFILVFAMVLSSVAVLYTTGFQAMESYQENEQITNAERGMISLADNFNDVLRYDGVERRYGELTLRGGTISTGGENTSIDIETDGTTREFDLGSLTYESDSDSVAYEGGGVFRASGDGSMVAKQPRIRCGDEVVVISIVTLDHDGERSLQSTDGVGLTIAETGSPERITSDDDVTITVDSPHYQTGWNHALKRAGWNPGSDPEDGTFKCEDVENVEIQIVTAEIDY